MDMTMEKFSREIGAECVKGGFWKHDTVVATIKNWTVTFEQRREGVEDIVYTYTIVRAPYVSKDRFQFKIYRKSIFSKLCEFLRMKVYMKVGYPEFERDFVIESNSEFKVRALFANSRIRQLIQSQSYIHLQLRKSELLFSNDRVISDVARLKSLYELFKEILNRLSDIESTYETELSDVKHNIGDETADDAKHTSF